MAFKKGNTHGKGRKKGTSIVPKTLRELNSVEIERVLKKYLEMSKEDLRKICKNDKTRALDAMVANIVMKSIDMGDQTRLNFILERLIGKVKDRIDLSSEDGTMSHQSIMSRILGKK